MEATAPAAPPYLSFTSSILSDRLRELSPEAETRNHATQYSSRSHLDLLNLWEVAKTSTTTATAKSTTTSPSKLTLL